MDVFGSVALAGIIAALCMAAVLYAIHLSGAANADMLRALGSLVTRTEHNALWVGLAIHILIGVTFAFFYVGVWSLFPFNQTWEFVLLGAVVGFAHGMAVSIFLSYVVAENHPIPRFRRASMSVAISHIAGHIVYGLILGLVIGWMNMQYGTVERVASILGNKPLGMTH